MRRSPGVCGVVSSVVVLAALVAVAPRALAEEGMWTLDQLPRLDLESLRSAGLELGASDLWDPEAGAGLATACISLGGCSASFASPDGLILTNHHCAVRAAQLNSTSERNLLAEGFVARRRADELPYPGAHAYVQLGFTDVTVRVEERIPDGADDEARQRAIEDATKAIVAECETEQGIRCRVGSMWGGLAYVLYRQLDIRDLRLVHIPAQAIGEFGGDVDNFEWPRHTGDYAVLRAYVGPDGAPADYAEANLPYHPKRWLRLSGDGVADGDLVLLLGYPGSTQRYRSSYSVARARDEVYPERIRLLEAQITALEKASTRSAEAALKNAVALKYLNNALKAYRGNLDGIRRAGLVEAKRAEEAELERWISADPGRQERYGSVLSGLAEVSREIEATARRDFFFDWVFRSSGLLGAAETIVRRAEERAKPDLERDPDYMDRNLPRQRARLERMQRTLDPVSDRARLRLMLEEAARLPEGQRVEALDQLVFTGGAGEEEAIGALLDRLYAGTSLGTVDGRLALFDVPLAEVEASGDPLVELALALEPQRREKDEADKRIEGAFARLRPALVRALAERSGGLIYPDANSTLRFNYGFVRGYSPRDAVWMRPFTTLAGVLEKETGEEPFASPPALLAAAAEPQGGYRVPALDGVPVDFLATLDSTGGNSGSPVLDGAGRLVGLLFDGNYESISADWQFNPAITRSIMVDIRYVLWVLDRVYHADELVAELGDPLGVLAPRAAPSVDEAAATKR